MKLSEYQYVRPDFEQYQAEFREAVANLADAGSAERAIEAMTILDQYRSQINTLNQLAEIRHSIDTNDAFYEAEDTYWNEYGPRYAELDSEFYQVLLNSGFEKELRAAFPKTLFLIARNQLATFDKKVIGLMQRENQLSSDYSKLVASAQIEFDGENRTIPQMTPFTQNTDREVRKEATDKVTAFFVENEAQFDQIYDDLVQVRTKIAHELGYKDYVEFAYVLMNRFDYDREMVDLYRKEILTHVVPVAQKLYQRQADRLGLDQLQFYDLGLQFLSGNATPKGTSDEIVSHAKKMYHELSPETGEFFDFMLDHELLDLESKKGKQSGGYCTYIPDFKSPFIFANFNGTSGDVDVLTHEAGHAFQCFESRWIKQPEIIFPTYESCEIHSMSMEFLTWPWMEGFFAEETEKYKFNHLGSALQFLPYGVLVDHFQHEVYEHPEMTPAERKAAWRKLEKMYKPEVDYSENPDLERGIYWYRQGHIFNSPFYYIDYTLAQVCAFQFWKRSQIDHDPTVWADYLKICQVGGTKTFLEIIALANLKSPFEKGALTDVIASIDEYLSAIPDSEL